MGMAVVVKPSPKFDLPEFPTVAHARLESGAYDARSMENSTSPDSARITSFESESTASGLKRLKSAQNRSRERICPFFLGGTSTPKPPNFFDTGNLDRRETIQPRSATSAVDTNLAAGNRGCGHSAARLKATRAFIRSLYRCFTSPNLLARQYPVFCRRSCAGANSGRH